jgi:hypothetical protein
VTAIDERRSRCKLLIDCIICQLDGTAPPSTGG